MIRISSEDHSMQVFPVFSLNLSFMAFFRFLKKVTCIDGRVASISFGGIFPFKSVWNA